MNHVDRDRRYLRTLVESVRVCSQYKPKMGLGSKAGLSLEDFQRLYRADPFYQWFGLDNPLMYAAHKAAGGMTSVYRQIGIGCERLFRQLLRDQFGLSADQTSWAYTVEAAGGRKRTLSLDGRIDFEDVTGDDKRRVEKWLEAAASDLSVEERIVSSLRGVVFEVRQGYKSKDSKRQNADLANAATAYTQAYLPCVVIMSAQIDADIAARYRAARWALLTGSPLEKSPVRSTYVFAAEVLGYDLAGFFERNADTLREEVAVVLAQLLTADGKNK